jgi:hypothetical protein
MPGALVRGLVQAFLIEQGKASLSREWLSDISRICHRGVAIRGVIAHRYCGKHPLWAGFRRASLCRRAAFSGYICSDDFSIGSVGSLSIPALERVAAEHGAISVLRWAQEVSGRTPAGPCEEAGTGRLTYCILGFI